jgi:hypothetical protein
MKSVQNLFDHIESVITWSLFIVLGTLGITFLYSNLVNSANLSRPIYYLVIASIICPRTPVNQTIKLIIIFTAFSFGVLIRLF